MTSLSPVRLLSVLEAREAASGALALLAQGPLPPTCPAPPHHPRRRHARQPRSHHQPSIQPHHWAATARSCVRGSGGGGRSSRPPGASWLHYPGAACQRHCPRLRCLLLPQPCHTHGAHAGRLQPDAGAGDGGVCEPHRALVSAGGVGRGGAGRGGAGRGGAGRAGRGGAGGGLACGFLLWSISTLCFGAGCAVGGGPLRGGRLAEARRVPCPAAPCAHQLSARMLVRGLHGVREPNMAPVLALAGPCLYSTNRVSTPTAALQPLPAPTRPAAPTPPRPAQVDHPELRRAVQPLLRRPQRHRLCLHRV